MNTTKIIGWLVFLLGTSIIVFTIYNTYNIFTGESPAPQIIAFNVEKIQGGAFTDENQITQMISEQLGSLLPDEKQITQMMSEQLGSFLPLDSLPLILNILVWTIGAGILIFGGAQIAGLGIKLLKND